MQEPPPEGDNPQHNPVSDFPLLTSDSKILGAMELKCNWRT
jgi:hypothetical protein